MTFKNRNPLVGFCLVVTLLGASQIAFAQTKPPNIVVIMADDAGYADFGFMNQFTGAQTEFKTPRLDQLAAQSIKFSNAYLPSSICSLTRAGLMTGKHPDSFGFSFNGLENDRPFDGLPLNQKTIFERVKELGYSTALVGKWHLGQEAEHIPTARGVDHFFGMWEAGSDYYPNGTNPAKIRRGDSEVSWWSEPSFNNVAADPAKGRYLTDAFGDEASKYIADHAGAASPFFLYAPLNAPHSPYQTKAQDYAQFPNLSGTRRSIAAMTLAMDRAIGAILDRIDDPNGDGDLSDSVADNTVVLFLNDNGGANSSYNNGPLAGYKASGWEGGIRTPMLVRGAGLVPGVFDQPVTALDIFNTVESIANAPLSTTNGVNLLPFLKGESTGPVHEAIVYRNRVNFAGIRVGEWKLTKPDTNSTWKLFRLAADGSGENVDLQTQYPEIVAELVKKYVAFDVTLDKARNSTPLKVHHNDVFIRRNDLGANTHWAWSGSFYSGDDPNATMALGWDDPSPNMVLVFTPNNAADYRSTNVVNRASSINRTLAAQGFQDIPGLGEVMLNEIRFEGTFAGSASRKATIDGKPLLFVKNLSGKAPGLRLDANKAAGPHGYAFNLDLNVLLYHDFIIEGNGNAAFRIGGSMNSFDPVSGIRKKGTSTVTFAGHNSFTGALIVEAGRVIIDGANAAVDRAKEVQVLAGGTLTLQSGLLRTEKLDVGQGVFNFLGGKVQARQIIGSLSHASGSVVIGDRLGPSTISGNFLQTGGDLTAIVNSSVVAPTSPWPPGPVATLAMINGTTSLAGSLIVQYDPSTYFPIGTTLTVLESLGGVQGAFSQVQVQGALYGTQWQVSYTANAVTLTRLVNSFNSADFDLNGRVDGNDFLVWQRNVGKLTPVGDANGDGLINAADLGILKLQYGMAIPSATLAQAIPEPAAGPMALLSISAMLLIRGSRQASNR